MKKAQKIILAVNIAVILAIFVMNYFYQLNGFDFTLKCICSGSFASLGILNLVYAFVSKAGNKKFYIAMSVGLVFAFLGDYYIAFDFISGAGAFALGHVFFVVAYCFLQKMKMRDYMISGVIFVCGGGFLAFSPILTFNNEVFKYVCIAYCLIISVMLGKAVSNFVAQKTFVNGVIALASFLFFFSDLMLVLDWFVGRWDWTDHACMGTYYPALCLLALSMALKCISTGKTKRAD